MTLNFSRELKIYFNEHHDSCTACSRPFQFGERTHLGFNKNNEFVYTCDNCSNEVTETVVRYSYSPRDYAKPKPNSFLWRYMDFTKYVSLLHSKALFFSNASLFNDPFEGAKGLLENKQIYDEAYIKALADAIADRPDATEYVPPTTLHFQEAKKLHDTMTKVKEERRAFTFLSCWHENEFESDAMWYLYSKDISNAIAIRTTYERLYLSLDRNPDIEIGRVNYIDLNTEFTKTNAEYWFKRTSFSHEREVRAVTTDRNHKGETGILKLVNLDTLIDQIFISPKANEWYVELVKDINIKYGVDKNINHSELTKQPFY